MDLWYWASKTKNHWPRWAPFILKVLMEDWEKARDGTQCLLQSLCPSSTALRNSALAMYVCVCVFQVLIGHIVSTKHWGPFPSRRVWTVSTAPLSASWHICWSCDPQQVPACLNFQVLSCYTTEISQKILHLHGLVLKFHRANGFNLLDTSYFENQQRDGASSKSFSSLFKIFNETDPVFY